MWSEVYRLISEKQHILITTHTNPDLDALGSELALDEYLTSLGKEVSILNSDSVPRPLRFVDPNRRLRTFSPSRHQPIIEQAEIIMPAYTCSVVAHAAVLSNNFPRFVDIKLHDYNMDLEQVESALVDFRLNKGGE